MTFRGVGGEIIRTSESPTGEVPDKWKKIHIGKTKHKTKQTKTKVDQMPMDRSFSCAHTYEDMQLHTNAHL